MSFDNSFDRHDLYDPARDRHDDPRDSDPYYGYERNRPGRPSEDDDYREMYESRMRHLQLRQTYLDGFARGREISRTLPIESFTIQDYFN